jgi:uncharacterized protein YdbL (DUF1318 family)
MKKITSRLVMLIIAVLMVCTSAAVAQGIRERMKERLPVIVELKKAGMVGENSKGYLEFVGAQKKNEDVVSAENSDRKKVYEAIAKKEETTADKVGSRRAKQIAEKAGPGEWLKDAGGKWYKK